MPDPSHISFTLAAKPGSISREIMTLASLSQKHRRRGHTRGFHTFREQTLVENT